MGQRGPVPKRSTQRRRSNSPKPSKGPAAEVPKPIRDLVNANTRTSLARLAAEAGIEVRASWDKRRIAEELVQVDVGKGPDPMWHPLAIEWFESLRNSGQSHWYEPSDWALARILAESISRDLHPRFVMATKDGKVVKESMPINGTSLAAYLKGMSALLATEGDRRRASLELQRPTPEGAEEGGADVSELAEWRERLGRSG